MKKALLVFAALAFIAGGVAVVVYAQRLNRPPVEVRNLTPKTNNAPPPRAKKDVPAGWLDEFTLTERSGQEFQSKDMEGKVWAASFFFSKCPGECHRQNQAIAQFAKEFGPKGVTFVSISVDPDSDTPEVLRTYARNYTESATDWLFLTSDDLTYIRRVGAEFFGVAVDKSTHGSRLILIDRWGNIRGYYSTNGSASPTEYAAIRPKLKQLLAEKEPPKEFQAEGAKGDSAHEVDDAP
jgi:protein SCO1/2